MLRGTTQFIEVRLFPNHHYFPSKIELGPNPNLAPKIVAIEQLRCSGFFGVRLVGPFVGDFLEIGQVQLYCHLPGPITEIFT